MSEDDSHDVDTVRLREKLAAVYHVASHRPWLTVGVILLSTGAAVLEGIGIGFILPIVEQAQGGGQGEKAQLFARAYRALGIPFTLEYVIAGVSVVMIARFTASFLRLWLRADLRTSYVKDIRLRMFGAALNTEIGFFDRRGSDDIINAVITQTEYAGDGIGHLTRVIQKAFLSLAYVGVALYIAPWFTVLTAVVVGSIMFIIRFVLESGFSIGGRVADANERIQTAVQAGIQGIRDVKLFRLSEDLYDDLKTSATRHKAERIKLQRNEAVINNGYQLIIALSIFLLIYLALSFRSLSLGGLGVFLFAMFRLGTELSLLNNYLYNLEGTLPHMVRTRQFLSELERNEERNRDTNPVPDTIEPIAFDDVDFSYPSSGRVLRDVTFSVDSGEFIAFVGESGGGKSTVVSLLAQLYQPDSGRITANGVPITQFDRGEWRSRISVVRQNPHLFNATLRYNLTIGNREATEEEIEAACRIARVTEFLDDLPNGYDTELGDDGVRLSGGQRQRVAIARSLLEDPELLILDEATSDLDSSLERSVHDGIEAMDRDFTMIVVAHRLSTVTNADRIYTIENGRIVETGPHQQLIQNNGQYAQLYAEQSQ